MRPRSQEDFIESAVCLRPQFGAQSDGGGVHAPHCPGERWTRVPAGTMQGEGVNPVVAEVMEERGIRDNVEARVRAMLADMGIDPAG